MKVTSILKPVRISQGSPNWIVTHRTIVLPPFPTGPIVIDPTVLITKIREATTQDPFRQRLETLIHSPFGCQSTGPSLHRSQVLLHEPYDPQAGSDGPHFWKANAIYAVNVQRKGRDNGPFVERDPFEA